MVTVTGCNDKPIIDMLVVNTQDKSRVSDKVLDDASTQESYCNKVPGTVVDLTHQVQKES